MKTQTTAPRTMPVLARAAASARVVTVAKTEVGKGWAAASDPQFIELVKIADARDIANYTAELIALRS